MGAIAGRAFPAAGPDPLLDGLTLGGGLVLLWALAWTLTKTAELKAAVR